jgi:urease alpha subunit
MFVSQASIDNGVVQSYGLRKRIEAVKGCRSVGKKDMKFNDTMPKMKVDPESYVSELTRRYLLSVFGPRMIVLIRTSLASRPSRLMACCVTRSLQPSCP